MSEALIGTWKSDRSDENTNDTIGKVTAVFEKNGSLLYKIYEAAKPQSISMTYRVEGNVIISKQASDRNEYRTEFRFNEDGKLVLISDDEETVFIKQ